MKSFKLKILLTLAIGVLLGGSLVYGQRQITGKITDAETGEGLIGASVFVKGTNAGTFADMEGKYTLRLPEGATMLKFSYTGYAEVEITLGASNVYDVQMNPGTALDEVVVIGYGSVKKEDATGAVNAVSEKNFNRGAIVNPQQLLAGKVAGVQITPNSGEPGGQGTIRVRGGTSVNAGNEPLFVIDGIPIEPGTHNPGGFSNGRNPLNFINPNDIESISVLKDASAAAIYGSRGANGVILITTKKGKKGGGTAKVSYDGYYSSAKFAATPNVLNADQFRNVVTYVAASRLEKLGTANTNWFEEMTQQGAGQSHNLSFSGGAENMGYRASVGYQKLDGVLKTSSTERTSFSLNYNHSLFENRLNLNANIKGSFTRDQFDPGQMYAAWTFDPTQPVYDVNNRDFAGFFEYGSALSPRNPVSAYSQNEDYGKTFRNLGNLDVEYKFGFLEGLSAKAILGYDIANGSRTRFQPTTYINKQVANYAGELRNENYTRINPLFDFYLNLKRDLGENHHLDITAGYSYQDFQATYPSFRAYNLTSDIFGANSTVAAEDFEANTSAVHNRLISFFGRANYNFMDKYLLTATLRRDGSTRFGPANRWGTFPSAAFAWRIMQEGFAESLSNIFYDLKVRASYGVTGNQEIRDFGYLPTYTFGDVRARYQFGYASGEPVFVTTVRPNGYDPNLKWEETASYNFGLDFGFFKGRLTGTVDYYNKHTKDLLFTVNIPAGTNLTDRILTNIGELENSGIELTLDAQVVAKKDFSWNIGFNGARNRNEVLAIDQVSQQGVLTGDISGGVGNKVQILQVGQPVNSFFVFENIIGEDGKVRKDGIDYDDNGKVDLADMYKDLNGDGKVDDLDKRPYEKPAPNWVIGISSQLAYKGFDLSLTMRGNAGNYVYNNNASSGGYLNRVAERGDIYLNNIHTSALVTGYNTPQYFSDYYVEDASFLRVDNITIGYTLPHMPKTSSLRIYATAQNPVVWTRYSGLDPEVGSGIDNNPYPWSRTFIIGASLGL